VASDTEIPKQTKKMLLFVSAENPMWSTLLRSVTQNSIADYIRVAHGTIPSWKNGGGISQSTAKEVFDRFRNKTSGKIIEAKDKKSRQVDSSANVDLSDDTRRMILDVFESFVENYDDNNAGIYSTAGILSIPVEECQKLMDEVIYKRGPVFPRMYYETKRAADDYFRQYKGVYRVWIRRGEIWIQCQLRVRYIIEIGGGLAIRCKLNLPLIDPEPHMKYWEYDGFLVRRPNNIFWMFEKRQRDRNDHLYFVTCVGRLHKSISASDAKSRTLAGTYLTTAQDQYQSVVTGDILMQRFDEEDPAVMRQLMHSLVPPLQGESSLCIDTLWTEFGDPEPRPR
jgi:hypothetical protein